MRRRTILWALLPVFAFGVLLGYFVAAGNLGAGGLPVPLVLLLVPAILAFAGPLTTEYWDQRYSNLERNRDRFAAHAGHLLERNIQYLRTCALLYNPSVWSVGSTGRYRVGVYTTGPQYISWEDLPLWPGVRAHLLADPTIRPLVSQLEARAKAGQAQKEALDALYVRKVEATLLSIFGIEFQVETTWKEYPKRAEWFPEVLITNLRRNLAPGSLTLDPTNLNHVSGEAPTPQYRLSQNSQTVLQTLVPNLLDVERFRVAYDQLRKDSELIAALAEAMATMASDARLVQEFSFAAQDYGDKIELSDSHLVGTCVGCAHLSPR